MLRIAYLASLAMLLVACGGGGGGAAPQQPVVAALTFTVSVAGDGKGTVTSSPSGINCGSTCTASYAPNTPVTLSAVAASGSNFAGWSGGACTGLGACNVTVSAATSVSATFANAGQQSGVMQGAVQFTGTYPAVGDVLYTDASGNTQTVTAYEGQVQVFFDSSATQVDAETAIQVQGAIILEVIPKIGYYLVQVTTGMENTFISAVRSNSHLIAAIPNIALSPEQAAVVIDSSYVTDSIPVPLNITGPVAIDTVGHGSQVIQSAQNNGATIVDMVSVDSIKDSQGNFATDKVVSTLTAIAQGSSIFNPGQPVYINMSNGAGAKNSAGVWVDANWEGAISAKMQAIANMPANLTANMVVTQSAGNCNMNIEPALQDLRNKASLRQVFDEGHFVLFGTDQTTTATANYPTGAFSNHAAGDKDVVIMPNAEAANGTSFAAPAGLAYLKQIVDQASVTTAQAVLAAQTAASANANHELVLAEAIAIAKTLATGTTPLTGTWVGTWNWSGPGSNGCTFSDGGAFSMTLTQTGTTFSGTTSAAGVQLRDASTCAVTSTDAATGTSSGTISGTTLNLSFTLVDVLTLNFSGTATLNNSTLTASFARDTGGSGSFTLTRQ
jgi:hypothetical protein